MSATVERCRSCSAPIIWAVTASGTSIPLDATETGVLVEVDDSALVEISSLFPGPTPVVRHNKAHTRGPRSHFATCPDAHLWRKTSAR